MRIIKTAISGIVAGWLAAACGWAAQPEPKVYRERLEPHWFAGRTCFWYRNDNPGGAREFILVEAGPGVRRAAFDHQRVAELLQKAGQPAAAPITASSSCPSRVDGSAADGAGRAAREIPAARTTPE